MSANFGLLRLPDQISFGRGSRYSLAPAVQSLGTRAFIVVDSFLVDSDAFREVVGVLDEGGVAVTVSSDVVPELPVESIADVAEQARRARPHMIVGFGGGSALDMAKLVALLVSHPGPLSNYYGENKVPGAILPVVAIPTTAGTGSEVTPIAVIADPARSLKVGISDPVLVPRFAIVDPELTTGAPPTVTAFAGIDALVHAVETITGAPKQPAWDARLPVFVGRNRFGTLLATEAVTVIGEALPTAVADGTDLSAREAMSWGSLLAGMAFGSAGTHLSHAIQYPVGALTHTPHGLGTGLLLPYVLQAIKPTVISQLSVVARALHLDSSDATESAQAAIDTIADINRRIGIPASLAEIGITEDQLPEIAELTMGVDRLVRNAPVPPSRELVVRILRAAFEGDRTSLRII
jgi:alcohol dehydrogenase